MKKMLLPFFLITACATAPKPTPAASEPVKVSTPAPKPVETEAAKAEVHDDLDALLKGLAIHFEFDRAELTADSQKRLDALAEKMRANPKTHIRVAGNADELGTEEYNLALGQKRADAVKTYLGHLGIDSTRIETVSFGEEKPVDPGHTPAAHSANRRDDIVKK